VGKKGLKRRSLLKGVAAAPTLAAGNLLWAPQTRAASRAHDAYFTTLNEMLKREGPGRPVMLLDTQRMNHNIDVIRQSVGKDKTYRVVVKSLPSVPLLKHVTQRANTNALMVFHQPFLNAVADSMSDTDALLGKPMPVDAARTFYAKLGHSRFDPATQVQWLIDSHDRLLQYQALARELGVKMRVNLEIDVGLRRGGFAEPAAVDKTLDVIQANDSHLELSGLMGYEPQLTGLKADLDHPAVREVLGIYHGFLDRVKARNADVERMTLNGAGSHTLRIYERDNTMNDLSAGSGVVKPTDFDTYHLEQQRPAMFIATPILKRYDDNPIVPDATGDMARLYYIYGGFWKANVVSPANVGEPIYQSTNQSPITTSLDIDLQVDDYMFLRPTQSEFVMLQFGDLLTVDEGQLRDRWPVFHQTG
jgi:D-serine deaminase-like pyridoxal phosphate-dependent protein